MEDAVDGDRAAREPGGAGLETVLAPPATVWLQCPRCQYDLSSTIMQTARCPECGAEVRLWAPPEHHRRQFFAGLTATQRRLLYWSPAAVWAIGQHLVTYDVVVSVVGLLVLLASIIWASYILPAWARWIAIAHPEDLMYGRWAAFFFAIVQNFFVGMIGAALLATLMMLIR